MQTVVLKGYNPLLIQTVQKKRPSFRSSDSNFCHKPVLRDLCSCATVISRFPFSVAPIESISSVNLLTHSSTVNNIHGDHSNLLFSNDTRKNGNVTSALSVCIINWFQHYWGPMCKSYHTHWSLSNPFLLCVCLNLSQCQSFSCWLTFPDPVNWLVNSEYARICGKHTKTANVWRLYVNFPIFVAFRIKKKTGLIVFRSFPEYHAMGHMLRLDMVSSNWASWFVESPE